MGKDLKGKECGAGICQRKDKTYAARFLTKSGKRREKHFATLPEAKTGWQMQNTKISISSFRPVPI